MDGFFKINIQDQYTAHHPKFNLTEFNETFEDLNLVSRINTLSDDIIYNKSYSKTPKTSLANIVDPTLAAGVNYYNPYEKDYKDPYQDSPNRLSLLALINKFNKTILVMTVNNSNRFSSNNLNSNRFLLNNLNTNHFRANSFDNIYATNTINTSNNTNKITNIINRFTNNTPRHNFYIPGGRCKIFESFENAAVRQFEQLTRIRLDSDKTNKLISDQIIVKTNTLFNDNSTDNNGVNNNNNNNNNNNGNNNGNNNPENNLINNSIYNTINIAINDSINNTTTTNNLLKENINVIDVCTYICFIFDENSYKIKHPNCKWVPIKQLQHYNDKIFSKYYKSIYLAVLQYLY